MPYRRKSRRSAAQRAATAKMIAARKARAAVAPPRKRRVRRKAKWTITPAPVASRAGRLLRYRRPNPVAGLMQTVTDTIVPSAIGGAGAVGLDVLLGVLPLPANLKTGPMRPVVRVAGAIGLGMLAGLATTKQTANQIAAGAMTVVLYDTLRGWLVRASGGRIPGLSLYEVPGVYDVGAYEEPPAIGYQESALQVGNATFVPDAATESVSEYVDADGVYR